MVFEENYEWFKRSLKKRFVYLNDYDVEDIVQQSAINLLSRADIAGVGNLTAYVYRTLHNGAKDFYKKRKNETVGEVEEGESPEELEQSVLAAELKEVALKAIDSLEEKQKYVYVETQLKGRSYEELARQTGEKIGTLLSRKSRAAAKIKKIVSDYLTEEETK